MDKHYLTPLFSPQSIAVFAGPVDEPAQLTSHARALVEALRIEHCGAKLQFFDINASATLSDLAHARSDLAVIALPVQDIASALEVAGRMSCGAALVVSTGVNAEKAAEFKAIARREGMHLLGPNSSSQDVGCSLPS